jgi:hypothetical protein
MQSTNSAYQEQRVALLQLRSSLTTGRIVGILLLLQLTAALMLPFILYKPINFGSPAFLTAGPEHSFQIRAAVLLSFFGSALTVYLGLTAWREFRRYSEPAAILFIVVCAVSCTLDLVHASTIMSMLSIGNESVTSGAGDSRLYEVVGAAVASARRSAHSTQLLAIGAWMFVFYISLLRFKMVPRVLAGIGIVGVTLQFVGVTLMMFLGYRSIGQMAMPLLPIHVTVAVWLIVKGFTDREPTSVKVPDIA